MNPEDVHPGPGGPRPQRCTPRLPVRRRLYPTGRCWMPGEKDGSRGTRADRVADRGSAPLLTDSCDSGMRSAIQIAVTSETIAASEVGGDAGAGSRSARNGRNGPPPVPGRRLDV